MNSSETMHAFKDLELEKLASIARNLDLRMEEVTVVPPIAPVAPVATAPVVVPPVVTPAAKPPWGTPEEFDAERAWALIEGLRADKITAATKAAEKATEDATKKVAETIGKALGLIPEDVLDPVKLQEKVSASESQSKQLALELAVFKVADGANANAGALLDSKSFLSKVAAIDPSDTAALTAAIAAVVTENPLLAKTAPVAPIAGMRPNPAQGSSSGGGPLGLDAQIAAATAAGDFKTAIRLKAAKAITPQ